MVTTSSEVYPPQDGDFVIQTSDDVLFGVHNILLRLSSPVMSDMFALGATRRDQPAPVSIAEDSGTFQNLLTFIYPDKTSTTFTSLDALLPVLGAAIKYQMQAVVDALQTQIMSKRISGKTYNEALLYDDPLRVYVNAGEFDLGDLENAAANATLNIDISAVPDAHSALASMPAIRLWQLLDLRKQRSAWLLQKCSSTFYIAYMDPQYCYYGSLFSECDCTCGSYRSSISRDIPASLLDMIKAYPCARFIRRIDFNVQLKCLRCGAAATAHFNKICEEYETAFGMF